MAFDIKMWHALRVHICFVCCANILYAFYGLFYRRIWRNNCLGVMNSIAIFSFCTHLTFDLIQRLRRISRLGIHPYGCWYTSRNTISMDATFYSILPSEERFLEWTANYRRRVRPDIIYLAPLDGCACAFEEWVTEDEKYQILMRWLKRERKKTPRTASSITQYKWKVKSTAFS